MTSSQILRDDPGTRADASAPDAEPEIDEICERARHGDFSRARDLVHIARLEAASATEFIERVLAPTMRRIGDLSETGDIERSRAGAMAAVASSALDDLAHELPDPRPERGRIGIACPTGEWHDLPAKMTSTILRSEGWHVSHLGASVPPAELGRFVADAEPVAVGLSCSIPANLVPTAEAISVVQRLGVPVVVGGTAFGGSDRRARALGADHWATDAASLVRTIQEWERRLPDLGAHGPANLQVTLSDQARARIIDSALRSLARSIDDDSAARLSDRTALRLSWLLSTAEVAALTSDDTVITDAFAWWQRRQPRQHPRGTFVGPAIAALAAAIEPGPLRSILLRAGEDADRFALPRSS